MNILERNEQLDKIIEKYSSYLQRKNLEIIEEQSLLSTKELIKTIEKFSNEERLLKIGIVGEVKAGKSTFLNSLIFDGENILPKAATPMTAALTEIVYGDKYRLHIFFYSVEDIEEMKKNSELYEKIYEEEYNKAVEKRKELLKKHQKEWNEEEEKKIAKKIDVGSDILVSSYEQYSKIKESGIDYSDLQDKVIEVDTLQEIQEVMKKYVGVNGEYMPFTKNTKIELAIENLKEIEIVDTPGINDPIVSRTQRTKELLQKCDVILALSSAESFLKNTDVELIENIKDIGISQIYLIASKGDTNLFGAEFKNKDLFSNLNEIKNKLKKVLENSSLNKMIKNEIILSSGMAESILKKLDNIQEHKEENKLLNDLVEFYGDYFNKNNKDLLINNLKKLSNLDNIINILKEIKKDKEEIIDKRKNDFFENYIVKQSKYINTLIEYSKKQIEEINNSDIESLNESIKNLSKSKNKIISLFSLSYDDIIRDLKTNLKYNLNNIINKKSLSIKTLVSSSQTTENHTKMVDKKGLLNVFARGLWGGGREEVRYTVEKINTTPIKAELELLKESINYDISIKYEEIIKKWKVDLSKSMVTTIRDNLDLEDIDDNELKSSILYIVNKLEIPIFNYDYKLSSLLASSGTINGNLVDEYVSEVYEHLTNFTKFYYSNMEKIIESIDNNLGKLNPLEKVISRIDENLNQFKEKVENKTESIDNYTLIINELNEM